MTANRQIVLDRLPGGERLAAEHFAVNVAERPSPGPGEVLLKARYISLDAANRAWMQGATYRSALTSGQVMAGGGLHEVVESNVDHLKPGDLVFADGGWQEYAVLPGSRLSKLPDLKPETHLLSVYGIAGLTAYFGLLECGQPKAGETVVISAAAGSCQERGSPRQAPLRRRSFPRRLRQNPLPRWSSIPPTSSELSQSSRSTSRRMLPIPMMMRRAC